MTTVTLNARYFVFEVQAESNAIIALTKHPQQTDSDAYIIELGAEDNTMTTVRRAGETPSIVVHTENILNGTEFREFWVTVEDGRIVLGLGNSLGAKIILSFYVSDAGEITSVSLASSNNKVAEWSFPTAIGKS